MWAGSFAAASAAAMHVSSELPQPGERARVSGLFPRRIQPNQLQKLRRPKLTHQRRLLSVIQLCPQQLGDNLRGDVGMAQVDQHQDRAELLCGGVVRGNSNTAAMAGSRRA